MTSGPQEPIAPCNIRLEAVSKLESGAQLVEKGLSFLQIDRVDALGEPAIDWSEKIAGLIPLALTALKPRHADRRARLPGLCLLSVGNRQCTLEISFRFRRIRLRTRSFRVPLHQRASSRTAAPTSDSYSACGNLITSAAASRNLRFIRY